MVPVSIGTDLHPDPRRACSSPTAPRAPPTPAGWVGTQSRSGSLLGAARRSLTRTYALTGAVIDRHERYRCGTLLPAEAVLGNVTALQQQGEWLSLSLELRNLSVLPLSLRTLKAPDGLDMEAPSLPLDLPPSSVPGADGPSTIVTLRLRVADCERYHQALVGQQSGPAGLVAELARRYENGTGSITLDKPVPNDSGFELDPQTALMGACPDLFFG